MKSALTIELNADQVAAILPELQAAYMEGHALLGEVLRDHHGTCLRVAPVTRGTLAKIQSLLQREACAGREERLEPNGQ